MVHSRRLEQALGGLNFAVAPKSKHDNGVTLLCQDTSADDDADVRDDTGIPMET